MGASTDIRPQPPIRLGMVGGGNDAFIGAVHRMAARLDGHFELVAGALSATPDKARRSGLALGLDPARCYGDFREMAAKEAARPDGIEAVAVVTPNHMHADPAVTFLEAGVHVICDKPLAGSMADARRIAAAARQSRALFVLTHNYTGYPLVREARERVLSGAIGTVRVVQVEYPQDWLTEPLELTGQKQAAWRTDPARAGAGGCIGDIGTHAYNLADFITGLEANELLAELTTFVPGRAVDDNVQIMLRYRGGARGMLWASQVAPGNENALRIRVYGDKGGLAWSQEEPNSLRLTPFGRPAEIVTRAGAGTGRAAARVTRIPTGHPEGYLEAFATLYTEAAGAICAAKSGSKPSPETMYPGIADGLKGIAFIDAAVRSATAGGVWTGIETLT